jgi:hypothetical protein
VNSCETVARADSSRWLAGSNRRFFLLCGLLTFVSLARGQVAVNDGFESGSFSSSWGQTAGVTIQSTGGAKSTASFAGLAAYSAGTGRELGARFDAVASSGAKDFTVDFHFRAPNTTHRQFNLQVSTSTGAIGSSGASINLKYDVTNGWAAFSTVWNPIFGLGSITPGEWYRLRVSGQDWGTATARWALDLSAAGGTNFINSATNLTWYQGGAPTSVPARYFVFTTVYGNNPGFEVDEVTARVIPPQPPVPPAVGLISGIYPHLAITTSHQTESGIGAVVPWAGRLWAIHYFAGGYNVDGAQHLWEIDDDLNITGRGQPFYGGSIASRMIHDATSQLLIGSYFIDINRNIRQIPINTVMPMHLSAVGKHLTNPNLVYFVGLGMERSMVDVSGNEASIPASKVTIQPKLSEIQSNLFGFNSHHGKGLYSGQGHIVYGSNGQGSYNGTPPGVLMEWDGSGNTSNNWTLIRRAQFDEVTGPGGIHGVTNVDDPIWALGWDQRSVLLMVRRVSDGWHTYRLPKGSHTHDAPSGWYVEWPRIRDVGLGGGDYLMNHHGTFYRFPGTFAPRQTGGLMPLSTFHKMIVDYADWNGRIVMGCNDASNFSSPLAGRVHSNLLFVEKDEVDAYGGPPAGFGGVWLNETVGAGQFSDPLLVGGFDKRTLHFAHGTNVSIQFAIETDAAGDDSWTLYKTVTVGTNGYAFELLPTTFAAPWLRFVVDQSAPGISVYLTCDSGTRGPDPALTASLAPANPAAPLSQGVLKVSSAVDYPLQFAADVLDSTGQKVGGGYYVASLDPTNPIVLRKANDPTSEATLRTNIATTRDFYLDAASVFMINSGVRFRLPRSNPAFDTATPSGWRRGIREVVTERQLMNIHGTIYELPRNDSGGMRGIRPLTTHGRQIFDYTTWRGMLVLAGNLTSATNDPHYLRSDDGLVGLWFGNVDDLWRFGAPSGVGGPWKHSAVTAGVASDAYLMFGYERKELELSHASASSVTFTVEVDFAANNTWHRYGQFTVAPGQALKHVFPAGYSAHWVRVKSDTTTTATAQFTYGAAAPQITGATMQMDGSFQITFTGAPGQSYTVRASSDLGIPLSSWTVLDAGTFTPNPAVFHDVSVTTEPRRCYNISTP